MSNYSVKYYGPGWLKNYKFPYVSQILRGWHSWEIQVGPHILMWYRKGMKPAHDHHGFKLGRYHYRRDTAWKRRDR